MSGCVLQEFDPWLYINLISYLKGKDESDMNGIESIVSRKIKTGDTSWIPTQPTMVLEEYTKLVGLKKRK